MRALPFAAVLASIILTACGDSSDPPGTDPVLPQSNQVISEENPLVLDEPDLVSVTDASVDFYQSVDDSCSNPADSQYLSLSVNLAQKTLLCVESSTTIKSTRAFILNLELDFPGTVNDVTSGSPDSLTIQADFADQGVASTIAEPIFATSDLMGVLPQSITATLGLYDIDGNIVNLSSSSLQLNGELPVTADTSPDGTDFAIEYNSAGVSVLTRYRDLPADKYFCVDHDRQVVDPATGDISREHVLIQSLTEVANGYHLARVRISEGLEPGFYEARVYEQPIGGGGVCSVQDGDEEAAPLIKYEIKS